MKHSILGWLVPVAIGIVFCTSHLNSFAQPGIQENQSVIPATIDEVLSAKLVTKEDFVPSSNDIRYKVSYKKHRKHGNYQSWYDSIQLRDAGQFRLGIPDGVWKGWYPNGNPKFIRNYSAEKYNYVKQEMKRNPKQVFTPLANAARQDPFTFTSATSSDNSFSDLYAKKTDEQIAEMFYLPPFSLCLHHGLYMNFYPDGTVKDSGYYKNGFREGHWEEWLNKGLIRASGTYRHGNKSGTWSYFDRNGKLLSLASYNKKGILSRQKFYE